MLVVSLCNLLLDKKILVSKETIANLGLESNGYFSTEINMPAINELYVNRECTESPGGASYNTIYALSNKGSIKTIVIDAIGNDDNGKSLGDLLQKKNIIHYLEQIEGKTAVCHVLLNENNRYTVSYLGVASKLSLEFFSNCLKLINDEFYIYMSCFFVQTKPKHTKHILSTSKDKELIFNLSNELVLASIDKGVLKEIIDTSNVVIGNEMEMKALLQILYESYTDVLTMIRSESKIDKIFVMTNADKEVFYAQDNKIGKTLVKKIPLFILDTCGAGDNFAAGFIKSYISDTKNAEICVKEGCEWAFEHILNQSARLNK